MRYIICLLTAVAVFLACNTGTNSVKGSFNADALETGQYVITIDRDTTIETKHGALLKIPKGALSTDKGTTVTLEIKEAYSLEQMILAGLTTQSDGDPLSSGGMIYIGAAAGQNVTFKEKIKVAVPASFLENKMQLFKGEEDNGRINWTDPSPLATNGQQKFIDTGKVLFESKCASCHGIGNELSGPDLAHFPKRIPFNEKTQMYWYHAFALYGATVQTESDVRQVQQIQQDHYEYYSDLYACNLSQLFGGKPVRLEVAYYGKSWFNEMRDILRYVQNESDRRNLPLPRHAYLYDCVDSCNKYTETVTRLNTVKDSLSTRTKKLIKENGPLVIKKPDPTWGTGSGASSDFEQRVSPANYDATYYQFTIESFGWYNIDALISGFENVKESELFVKITGQYKEKIKTYLIIPSVKAYGEGGPADRNAEEFAYFTRDGKLPLPQNVTAWILAISEADESVVYGLKQFTTSTSQELEVELHASTKEEFHAAMKQFDMKQLSITVADSKNSAEIKQTNASLKEVEKNLKDAENLKPKGCDCQCGTAMPDSISTEYIVDPGNL